MGQAFANARMSHGFKPCAYAAIGLLNCQQVFYAPRGFVKNIGYIIAAFWNVQLVVNEILRLYQIKCCQIAYYP